MRLTQIQEQIDSILQALASNPASEVIEYTIGDKTVKKNRDALYKDLAFWREELSRASKPKRTILTRF